MILLVIIDLVIVEVKIVGTPRIEQILQLLLGVAIIGGVSAHGLLVVFEPRLGRTEPGLVGNFVSRKGQGLEGRLVAVPAPR